MPRRITKLELTHFRGATQPVSIPFDPDQSMVMIFGENGSGKSTLVDAIDFVCNGNPGSISNRASTRAAQHLPALGAGHGDVKVVLETKEGSRWQATLTSRGQAEVSHLGGAAEKPAVSVLRRADLLKLVEAPPADRYTAIKPFIDVGGVEASENTLRTAERNLRGRFDTAATAKNEAEDALGVLFTNERSTEEPDEVLAWARTRAAENLDDLRTEARHLDYVIRKIDEATSRVQAWQADSAKVRDKEEELREAETYHAALRERVADEEPDLLRLLQEARRYLQSHTEPSACPLCTQPVDAEALRERVDTYLEVQRDVAAADQEVRNATTALRSAEGVGRQNAGALRVTARELIDLLRQRELVAVAALGFDWDDEVERLHSDDEAAAMRATELVDALHYQEPALREALTELNDRIALHDNISDQLKRVDDNTAVVEGLDLVQKRLQSALAVCEAIRRSFIEQILDGIKDEVNRLYEKIHPSEDSGLNRLYMDENRRGSLKQTARFAGTDDVVPQAYFSESHLDTLGFCLWVALAKQVGAQQAVLVLDDVFTSVDAQHFRRIADLLNDEASNFQQLIVATHSRHWHQFYSLSGGSAHLVHLTGWSIGGGIQSFEDHGAIDKLAVDLTVLPLPRQAVASQAGVLLERVLDEVAELYGCSLARKRDSRYTLGEFLDTTRRTLQIAEVRRAVPEADGSIQATSTRETITIAPLFDAVNGLTFIRNEVGAHFNVAGLGLSDADVAAFGQAAHDLVAALICPRCGRLPSKNKTSHWGCSCPAHKTELTPLQKR